MAVNRENYDPFAGDSWNGGYNTASVGDYLREGDMPILASIWNDLTGQTSQQKEFAQQEYLQDKMNEYNTPANQIARMQEAGINPNIAAAGIAQSGSESAQAPAVSSNTQGASAGLSAVGSLLGGIGNLSLVSAQKRNLDADSTQKMADATRTNSLLFYEQNKFEAETAELWTKQGMESSMAQYWSAKAAYADQNEYLDVQGKLWSIAKCSSEIDVLNQQVEIMKKDIELRKLQISEEQYKLEMIKIDKYFADERKRIYQERGIDVNQTEDGMLIEAYTNGHSQFILDAYRSRSKQIAAGSLEATRDQLREQLQIEYEESLKNRANELDQDADFQEKMNRLGIASDVSSTIIQTVLHYLFGTGFSVGVGNVRVTNSEPHRGR